MSEEKAHAQGHGACCDASEAMRHFCRAFGASEQVSQHFRQSRIEFLKGIRTLLDERIERLGRTAHKGTRVVVE